MKIKYFYLLSFVIIFIGLFNSLRFTISTGNQPWFDDRLCIDARHYKRGMSSIVTSNDFFNLKNMSQSPGYQIYLAVVYKIFPDDNKIFKIIKMISWIMSLLSTGLIFYLGEKYFDKYVGAVSAALFSFSYKYYVYINLLQYEVLLGFLLLLYVYFLVELESSQ
ncbi:MAG: glycosyltransferase family 39 protein, partial [Candidatus Omnitrophota bacterium]